ncbi:hypothetical protein A0H81_14788 [Grifola frondosa]|uniref:Uncharacterized protein n=1 Tax=Grifola frondosa TaxID=5627 RepID=A0A1C7LKT8_GRIFR|nr:hypothetical protein A0H81_14788 [Grifola frondosa]
MSNPFIVVCLVASQSARWTSWHGIQASERFIPTRPFLALPLALKDVGTNYDPTYDPYQYLFVVSPQKSIGISEGFYLPLTSSKSPGGEGNNLIVNPPFPLSFGWPLYLHSAPFIRDNKFDLRPVGDPTDVQYRLDESSFRLFCDTVKSSLQKRRELLIQGKASRRISGGDEKVQQDWDSWSGSSDKETLHDPGAFAFERVPFAELSLPLEPPTIYTELRLFRQMTNDFSWAGITPTISWAEAALETVAREPFFDIPLVRHQPLSTSDLPYFSGDLLETANALHSMRIPYDGDPPPKDVVVDEFAWDDEPTPTFPLPSKTQPPIPFGDVRFVVFDLFGTLLDREHVVRDVLQSLVIPEAHKITSDELYQLYIDYESHRSLEHPSSTFDLIRGCDHRAPTDLSATSIPKCQPRYRGLCDRGLKLLCISPVDATASEEIRSILPRDVTIVPTTYISSSLHCPTPSLYSELLNYCGSVMPGIQADQVLLVTTARYRTLEPATAAQIPVALLHCSHCAEADIQWRYVQTAAISLDDLKSLRGMLIPALRDDQ